MAAAPLTSLHLDTARTWRGGQNQVRLTVSGLAAQGHRVTLATPADGELRRRIGDALPCLPFAPASEFDVRAAWQLAAWIRELAPDVVHAHDARAVSLAAMARQMRPSEPRPLLVVARRVDFHLKQHALSRWKYRAVDLFIAASAMIGGLLRSDGVEASRIVVVHDGVDVQAIDAVPAVDVRAACGLPHGCQVIGNVAALAEHKGQRHLVAAMTSVLRHLPDARLVIVGTGELHDPIRRQIHDLGLARHVVLAGFRPDAAGLMKSFDVFVMSSLTEGLGSAILEAMACERPVVATRTGGIPEVVANEATGLLVPPADAAALAAALVNVLTNPALATQFGSAGRQRVQQEFSIERLVAGTLAAYRHGLDRR